eukprot:gene6702-13585_t
MNQNIRLIEVMMTSLAIQEVKFGSFRVLKRQITKDTDGNDEIAVTIDHDHNHDASQSHDHDHDHSHENCGEPSHFTIDHGHSHEHLNHPGSYNSRTLPKRRRYDARAFVVGIGGPVGSGKTHLMLALCRALKDKYNLCAVTNDIFTREDGEFLVSTVKHQALDADRIRAVETGGCPHAAIREDITANLIACEELTAKFHCEIVLLESGGDNLAADFSRELADFTIYVIDTAGGDKIPRKGGPGITQSDVLVVNKTDLAEAVGSSLEIMRRDAALMRGDGPVVFSQVKHGPGVEEIVTLVEKAYMASRPLTVTSS